jgi:hypothetical protein
MRPYHELGVADECGKALHKTSEYRASVSYPFLFGFVRNPCFLKCAKSISSTYSLICFFLFLLGSGRFIDRSFGFREHAERDGDLA